jgi:AcrR family transcriptional regulator
MARPRTITDEALLEAAYGLVMAYGPKGLTFEKLGEKVNLVPGALVRRFSNKHKLLAETDRYALNRSSAKLHKVMARHDAPVDAIIAGFVEEMSFATTIQRFINGQEYLLMDLADKDLYSNYHESFHQRHQEVKELLEKAQLRGELSNEIDTKELAQFLQLILHGAGHVWAMDQKGPIENYISKYVQLALKPYRTNSAYATKDDKKEEIK